MPLDLYVGPVLSNTTETSIDVMFEASGGTASVAFGDTVALGRTQTAQTRIDRPESGRGIFHATLTGLSPDCVYHYQVRVGGEDSPRFSFRTPPVRGTRRPFRFAVYSDCQQRPEIHRKIVDTTLVQPSTQAGRSLHDDCALALVVGDVVQHGRVYEEYRERLFAPAAGLFPHVPLYTAIGNHEENSGFYFDYLSLPRNGSPGFEKHWYSFDYGNAHFIALDTNKNYRLPLQLAWLEKDLAAAASDPRTDVIFAYFHHPWKSELWVEGEEPYAGEIVRRLEAALVAHGKVGAFFFGHTHGYARGQSKNAPLYWVNVATAGGTIDHWGDYEQRPYPEFQKSFDDYGIVMVDVSGAGFVGTRLAFGTDKTPGSGAVRDTFAVRRTDEAPAQPSLALKNDELVATPFAGVVPHLETEWELASEVRWLRREKIYWNEDVARGTSLTRTPAPDEGGSARVRYRNERLVWSPWSEAIVIGKNPE